MIVALYSDNITGLTDKLKGILSKYNYNNNGTRCQLYTFIF